MDNDFKYVCKCGAELPPNHKGPCPECGQNGQLHKAYEKSAHLKLGLDILANSRLRQKRGVYSEFSKQMEQGRFESGDPSLKRGVNLVRIIDRENNEYHEVVENAETGKIIREVHEPLTQHRPQVKQPTKKIKDLRRARNGK